jgi:hypothetical protein
VEEGVGIPPAGPRGEHLLLIGSDRRCAEVRGPERDRSKSSAAAIFANPAFADNEGNVAGAEDPKPRMQPILNYEADSITA